MVNCDEQPLLVYITVNLVCLFTLVFPTEPRSPAVTEKYESLPSCKVNLMSHTWKQDRKKNQYLIIKCIFLIYVVTIAPGSCYLQKLDLDKVIWDLLMVAASCTVWEAPLFRPRVCWEKKNPGENSLNLQQVKNLLARHYTCLCGTW